MVAGRFGPLVGWRIKRKTTSVENKKPERSKEEQTGIDNKTKHGDAAIKTRNK